ncbi:hypothetical protein QBC44DRAFT_309076 [Cladorrhinum sp. PSN332]|nr:hypothetical protein QBC44DRAFT_309076 [Cladorrhinum sp. PSN332]
MVDVFLAHTGVAIIARPPPLQVLSTICQFTRVLYQTQWRRDRYRLALRGLGPSEASRPDYWVNLDHDTTFLRIRNMRQFTDRWSGRQVITTNGANGRTVHHPFRYSSRNALAGVRRVAIDGYGLLGTDDTVRSTLEHFTNWVTGGQCERIIFLPVTGLENPPNPALPGTLLGGPLQLGAVQIRAELGHPRYVNIPDPTSPWKTRRQMLVDARRLI